MSEINALTKSSIALEYKVCYLTRLGNLCGTATPTPEQEAIASTEASEHIKQLTVANHEND